MDKMLLNDAMAYCSRAERCIYDVEEWLRKKVATADEIEVIVAKLKELNFINESRYAQAFVHDKFCFNKWGRIKIEHALRIKKIASETILQALEGIDECQYEQTLCQLIATKRKSMKAAKTAAQSQAAVFRFALSRGFEYDYILRCMR